MAVVIPKELFSMLENAGKTMVYPAKSKIFTQGDKASDFYIVEKGRVRVYSLSAKGKERTVEVLGAGRIFGDSSFIAGSHRKVSIEAVTDCKVICCCTEELINLCSASQQLMRLVFQHMADTCNYLTAQLVQSNHYNSTQKVCAFLLEESAVRKETALPYTHDEIAASVALNRVTVSRIMSVLQKEKFVEYSYGYVKICDREGLAAQLTEE